MEISELINFKQTKYEGLKKRLTIDGKTEEHISYRFPIGLLYYNDLNGRIASYIEEYNDTHDANVSILKNQNIEQYNDILADYIIDSAGDKGASFENTKNDIAKKGQQIPGVILTDGRIIDGNRRFTALRKLYNETGDERFAYFEAVCLDAPKADDKYGWKRIKSLELNLQFNVDEKKGYNRIDELVSFYRDVMDDETKMFDEKSYCFASGLKKPKFNENKKIVNVMLDYLDWRGKSKSFYILKNEKLDGPIEDIAKTTAKMSDEEWNSIKDNIFLYITIMDEGDRTRNTRELLKSAKSEGALYKNVTDKIEKNIEKVVNFMAVVDKRAETPEETSYRNKLKQSLLSEIKRAYNDGKYSENENNAYTEPCKNIEKAIKIISDIDLISVKQLSDHSRAELLSKIQLLKIKIQEIENAK